MSRTIDTDSLMDDASLESSFNRIRDIDEYIRMYENDLASYARRLEKGKIERDDLVKKLLDTLKQFNVDHPHNQYDLSLDDSAMFEQHLKIRPKRIQTYDECGKAVYSSQDCLDSYFWGVKTRNSDIANMEKNMKNVTYVLRNMKEDHELEREMELVVLRKKVAKFNAEHPDDQLDASLQIPAMYKQYLFLLSKFASRTSVLTCDG